MSRLPLYLFLIPAIYLFGCKPRTEDLLFSVNTDKRVREILENAIMTSGGQEKWYDLRKIKFDKVTQLFDSTGRLESSIDQHHRYHLFPKHILEIIWQDSLGNHQLMLRNNDVEKYLNGHRDDQLDSNATKHQLLAAEYAVLLPFKLLDPGIHFTYEGRDTFDGETVHIVRAQYQPETVTTYNTSDVWWHYINADNFVYEGYKVKHEDHYSLVINDEFTTIDELMLPHRRRSYLLDSSGKKLFKRADYLYHNYHIRLGEDRK
ncbi:MAG: hypothetical protein KDC80_14670 [Saprospiraceae bacterium]|nr:hypothetical protein [Saprospiraceae bacterium]